MTVSFSTGVTLYFFGEQFWQGENSVLVATEIPIYNVS